MNLCTIIILWGRYCYKRITMGDSNVPDIFQHNMNNLFHRFEFIRMYIYELLILTKVDWIDYV